jgi:hypothetical protein
MTVLLDEQGMIQIWFYCLVKKTELKVGMSLIFVPSGNV